MNVLRKLTFTGICNEEADYAVFPFFFY